MNKVEEYINTKEARKDQLIALRQLLLDTGMEETVKWGMPAYCIDNKNVIGLAAFKNWSTLWFHKGVYLKDEKGLLFNAQEGKTKEMRQWRFTSVEEIEAQKDDIVLYLNAAMDYQKMLNDMIK